MRFCRRISGLCLYDEDEELSNLGDHQSRGAAPLISEELGDYLKKDSPLFGSG